MNINPADMEVRQGYSLAEIAATVSSTNGDPQKNPTQEEAVRVEPDTRSQAAASAADRMIALETADKISKQLDATDTTLKIRLLDNTQDGVQVEIVDKASSKVLRKIPQDELIKLSASIKKMSGLFLNQST